MSALILILLVALPLALLFLAVRRRIRLRRERTWTYVEMTETPNIDGSILQLPYYDRRTRYELHGRRYQRFWVLQ